MSLETFTHAFAAGSAFWGVLSAVINVIFWFRTPEAWIAFAERKPQAAALIRICRGWGVDPNKGLIALRDFVAQRAGKGGPSVRPPPPLAGTCPICGVLAPNHSSLCSAIGPSLAPVTISSPTIIDKVGAFEGHADLGAFEGHVDAGPPTPRRTYPLDFATVPDQPTTYLDAQTDAIVTVRPPSMIPRKDDE